MAWSGSQPGNEFAKVTSDPLPLRDKHLVSVVIPAYNAETTLDDTLRSVRHQSYANLEIIIVDDGSTDNTLRVAKMHASTDARIRIMSQANAGVAAARNAGWQSSQSDFIAFVDADDLWEPTKIEKQLTVMLAGGDTMGLVYTWFAVINERNQVRFKGHALCISGEVLDSTFKGNFVGNGSSPLVRRTALIAAHGYDSALRDAGFHGCEDMLLYYRIARHFQFGLVPEHLTGYRVVSGRMSSNRLRMFRSFKVADEMVSDYPTHQRAVDTGISLYVQFLIGEATAYRDYDQVMPLLREWKPRHVLDRVVIPLTVLCRKIGNFRGLPISIGRLLGFGKQPVFPFGG
jgi:glycosyltransferase involved in cell wall biosynthesis